MHRVHDLQHPGHGPGHAREVFADPVGGFFLPYGRAFGAQGLGHLARVDAHRAARAAQAIRGAGAVALVAVGFQELGQLRLMLGLAFQALYFAPGRDALARGQGDVFGGADGLAEPALDALVHQFVGGRQGFEVL